MLCQRKLPNTGGRKMSLLSNRVSVSFTGLKEYPLDVPFDPPEKYPELGEVDVNSNNQIYRWVRETLKNLGLDNKNFGTQSWNPLKEIVRPGMTVFIKPNTVRHYHLDGKDVLSVIVHASILRPILDYVCIALKGSGKIIIGDSQVIEGLFDEALTASQLDKLLDWYRQKTSIPIECIDLRMNRSKRTWLYGKWGRVPIEKDPRGYTFVNLGEKSYFRDIDPSRLRIAIASHKVMYKHHSEGRHEYLFPNSVLESDVIINIPKLKTHRRTGITIALKNFMGIPALKDSLPHFTTGAVEEGGDQYIYPSFRKRIVLRLHDTIQTNPFVPVKFVCAIIKKLIWNSKLLIPFKDDVYEAMWYGNDTVWRTLLDINRAVLYADKNGILREQQQRNYFCFVDGIIAGEKDGPVSPDPVKAGVLMAGFNPVAMDDVACTLMGFDISKIKLVSKAEDETIANRLFYGNRNEIIVVGNEDKQNIISFSKNHNLHFEPHPNWKGHIELEN